MTFSSTAQSDREFAHATIEDLVNPFRWDVLVPTISETERRKLYSFLQAVEHVNPLIEAKATIPPMFWACVKMPSRVLPMFRTVNDAKALAQAVIQSAEQLVHLQNVINDRDDIELDDVLQQFLESATEGITTANGAVFTDPATASIWFGRKAGSTPHFTNTSVWDAFRLLFGLTTEPIVPDPKADRGESKKQEPKAKKQERESKKQKPESKPAAGRKAEFVASVPSELRNVPIGHIKPSKENHRKTFDQSELKELAESIKSHGVLQPLLLRPISNDDKSPGLNYPERFVIIAGERRYRAAQLAGLTEVPAQIVEKSGVSESLAMLEENIRRVDLNPIERAQAIKRLMDEHQLSQKEVGQMVGVQQGQISNELRLLNLPESLQKLVASGAIAPTLIRTVLPVAEFPAVVNEIAQVITKALKDEESIDVRFLEQTMCQATLKHSRPMRYENNWNAWAAPDPKDRHFSKTTPEQEKALDVRELKFLQTWQDQRRAFNLQLFDELNKAPLANRLKKHKEHKAKQQSDRPAKTGKGSDPFVSEWQARREIEAGLSELLASALEQSRNKDAVRRVALAVSLLSEGAIAEDMIERKHWSLDGMAKPLLEKLSVSPAALEQLLRKTVVNYLRAENGGRLAIEDMHVFGTALGVDLVPLWKPSEDFVKTLSDHGRQLLAETLPGQLPAFLRPLFGLKDEAKPAKTKKGKAA